MPSLSFVIAVDMIRWAYKGWGFLWARCSAQTQIPLDALDLPHSGRDRCRSFRLPKLRSSRLGSRAQKQWWMRSQCHWPREDPGSVASV